MRKIYVAATADKYELPVAVESSVERLAADVGMTPGSVLSAISRQKKRRPDDFGQLNYKFYTVQEDAR